MQIDFRADLHCHSTCSDGSDSPIQLLEKAKAAQLSGLSITDHDTIAAYTSDFFAAAESLGIRILPGVELSSEWNGTVVHVLGYGFDLHSSSFTTFLKEMQTRRTQRNFNLLEKLKERKMSITMDELMTYSLAESPKKTIGRPHIAALMVKKGYVTTTQEAFDRYLKEGGLCYVSGFKFTPLEAIDEIHKAHGKASLAHPHFLKTGSFLRHLLSLPFDGMECYYANLPKELEARWLKICKEKNWIVTGGSDYHGAFKPHLFLGSSWVSESTFEALSQTSR